MATCSSRMTLDSTSQCSAWLHTSSVHSINHSNHNHNHNHTCFYPLYLSSYSAHRPHSPLPSHPSTTTLLDLTTIHGLLLYSFYLFHRLRLLRQRRIQTHHQNTTGSTLTSSSRTYSQECRLVTACIPSLYHGDPRYHDHENKQSSICINHVLPPEILLVVFQHLSYSKALQCMLVCKLWRQLLGPTLWKAPRVLWSRHWSRFYPILSLSGCKIFPSPSVPSSSSSASPSSQPASSLPSATLSHGSDVNNVDMTSSSVVRTGQLFTDRVMAGLHELDRQEIEYFTDWQRKDKARRRRAIKRRRDAKQRHESISRHTTGLCHFWNRIPDILPEESYSQLNESSDDSDDDAQSHSHSPVEDQEHEDRDRFLFENHLWSNRLQQTSDDSDTDSAYDPSDDETVLFRMVETFDYVHMRMFGQRESSPTLTPTSGPTTTQSHLHLHSHSQPQSQLQGQLYPQKSATETVITTPSFPLAGTLARLRRKQATKESRQQRMYLCRSNGLPKALPLSTCGQWIQVINLHQETPYPHRTNPQSLTHASSPDSQSQRRRRRTSLSVAQNQFSAGEPPVQPPIFQGPPGTQNPAPQQQTDRQSFLASLFGWNLVQRPQQQQQQQQQQIGQTEPLEHFEHHNLDWTEPPRLRSRRDYITDNTLATVLDHCPRLCRLLISECHGITDHGLALIRNAECVRRGTLVSLHMAGCDKITDRGLLTLATGHHDWNKNMALKEPLESRAGEADITLKLESLDMAGCFQISDRGLIPLIKACGRHLEHLRVSECDLVTARSVFALAEHCPHIKWLDLARSGPLTDNCLTSLAQRCLGLEWLNLARQHPSDIDADIDAEVDVHASGNMALQGSDTNGYGYDDDGYGDYGYDDNNTQDKNTQRTRPDIISDKAIALICELCPQLQLLDLSYIVSLTNNAIESLAQTAHALVCLTIIGCPNITSHSLVYLAKLRNTSGCLGCITMGDAQGISERDIEQIMQGTLSGWQKSLVDETNLGEILGRSWDE